MAMSATTLRILKDAQADLMGALPEQVQVAYFKTLREFCNFTNVWQEDIDIPLIVNDASYTFAPADGGQIIRVLLLYNSTDQDQRPVPANYQMRVPGQLVLRIPPSQADTWVIRVSKNVVDPTDEDGNPEIPASAEWIIEQYQEGLTSGILSKMMAANGKPYSNPQLAALHGRYFLNAKMLARSESVKGRIVGQTNWAFPGDVSRGSQRSGGSIG